MTGYDIDVYRDSDEVTDDVDLDEFRDEIEPWIIDALKGIGCDTARAVLEVAPDELAKRTDLEDETVIEVLTETVQRSTRDERGKKGWTVRKGVTVKRVAPQYVECGSSRSRWREICWPWLGGQGVTTF